MKSILITGASSGIGRATAELFLDKGWIVGLLARREAQLVEIAKGQDHAVVLPADVTDANTLQGAFDTFMSHAGRLDVLFNNAGMFGPTALIDDVSVDDWDMLMNVNVKGMFLAARCAFAQMRAQSPKGGRIINNGSISAHNPRIAGALCYTTSKHAITGMTKSLSLDGRAHDIACGQIDIGNAESELVAKLAASDPSVQTMDVAHAASSVLHMAELPLSANVQFMTVMATKMPYIGRG